MSSDVDLSPPDGRKQSGDSEPMLPAKRRSRLAGFVKSLIAIAVIVGLLYAGSEAMQQWQTQRASLQTQIDEIERQLAATDDTARRSDLERTRDRLQRTMPRLQNLRWDWVALAAVLYAAGLVPSSFLLRRALVTLGQRPRLGTSIAAQLLGHVGKYVPGKAMVVVIRAGALVGDGVGALPAAVSIFLETFLMMGVGAALAAAIVWWLPVPSWISKMAILVAIAASLPTLPPVLRVVAARVSKNRDLATDRRIGCGLFLAGWGWSALSWVLIGGSFASLVVAIPSPSPLPTGMQLYAIATAAISLAMVIGFASLLPGGAGVRELVLTSVLGVATSTMHGILAALAARIMFIAVEGILAVGAWLWLRRYTPGDWQKYSQT